MMFGKAADFNRDMYQVNIASIDGLMQLVQVVDSMGEGQGVIMGALERMSDDGGGFQDTLNAARQACCRRNSECWSREWSRSIRSGSVPQTSQQGFLLLLSTCVFASCSVISPCSHAKLCCVG